MRRLLAALALLALLPLGRADALIADLSEHLVAITTGFSGTEILVFGSVAPGGEIVVSVRGPGQDVTMHRKSSVLGVWINTASFSFRSAPSYYAIAASKPLAEIAGEGELQRLRLGLDYLVFTPKGRASPNIAAEWSQAYVRAKQRAGLFSAEAGEVTLVGDQLFRARIPMPTNVPTGSYQVDVYHFQDGLAVAAQTLPLSVGKVGLEAEIYDFAQQQGPLYGLAAIAIALLAGWLAHLIFRRR